MLQPPPATSDTDWTSHWKVLSTAITDVQCKNKAQFSLQTVYHMVYLLTINDFGPKVYATIGNLIVDHLRKNVCSKVATIPKEEFLTGVLNYWRDHLTTMQKLCDLLSYVDNVIVPQGTNEDETMLRIYDLGLNLFRLHVLDDERVKPHITSEMLATVKAEREKEVIDWITFKNVCEMLISVGIESRFFYEEVFEAPFLLDTAQYFRKKSDDFIKETSAIGYIQRVNEYLKEEEERAKRFLDAPTREKISTVLYEQLIAPHMETVVNMDTGVEYMIRNNLVDQLKELYALLSFVPGGTKVLIAGLAKYLRAAGTQLTNPDGTAKTNIEPVKYIENLVNLRKHFKHILTEAFGNNPTIQKSLQIDFKHIINLDPRVAEYLSIFFDHVIKGKVIENGTQKDIEAMVDKGIDVFCFLNEKDVFEKSYRQLLAKRILSDRGLQEVEKNVVGLFRKECGSHYTHKFEAMFRDMDRSAAMMETFKEVRAVVEHMSKITIQKEGEESKEPEPEIEPVKDEVDVGIKVLTKVFWPMNDAEESKIILPPVVERSLAAFQKYYHSQHDGRRIVISASLGTAEINAYFYPKADNPDGFVTKKKILVVSTYQMCILERFNHGGECKYEDLLADTKLPERDLKRALFSMCMAKRQQRVLLRQSPNRNIGVGDIFSVNDEFPEICGKNLRVRINTIIPKAAGERPPVDDANKKEKEPPGLDAAHWARIDRPYEIDAAAVRIMKSRQKMTHAELVAEVTRVLTPRFVPDPQLVKRRIVALVEREFFTRDENDFTVYQYVA